MSQEISKGILLEQFNLETFASKVLNFLFGPKGHSFGLSGGEVSEIEKGEEELLKQAEQMKREGKSDEEIQAFVIKENQADTTGDYANKVVARYEGLDYTQKELDTAARIKKRKQLKKQKKK